MKKIIRVLILLMMLSSIISFSYAENAWGEIQSNTQKEEAAYQKCVAKCDGNEWNKKFCECKCNKGIILNTHIPFVWRCIDKNPRENWNNKEATTIHNVLPKFFAQLSRVVMVAIIIIWFLWILIWGLMVSAHWAFQSAWRGKELIKVIIIGLIILWASWIILNLINPNFFGTSSWF